MEQIVRDFWAVIAAFVAGIVWLIRLEGRGQQNTKDVARQSAELVRLEERLAAQRREDMDRQDREWSAINSALEVMQTDIKELLSRK